MRVPQTLRASWKIRPARTLVGYLTIKSLKGVALLSIPLLPRPLLRARYVSPVKYFSSTRWNHYRPNFAVTDRHTIAWKEATKVSLELLTTPATSTKVFNVCYLVTQCSLPLPRILLLHFFVVSPVIPVTILLRQTSTLPFLATFQRNSRSDGREGRLGISFQDIFSQTGVFQKRHALPSHCSARGSFTNLHLCSVTLSVAQTCPGESTASSLNFI